MCVCVCVCECECVCVCVCKHIHNYKTLQTVVCMPSLPPQEVMTTLYQFDIRKRSVVLVATITEDTKKTRNGILCLSHSYCDLRMGATK